MKTFGIDYWRQAEYSDLAFMKAWCEGLSEACWQTGESGLWSWFGSICGIEMERRRAPDAEPLCWDMPTMFMASPARLAAAALDARALLTLCENPVQRQMVDKLLFELLSLLSVVVQEQVADARQPAEKV